jgi:inorganic pyrophosphatase/exopolyphosphatase
MSKKRKKAVVPVVPRTQAEEVLTACEVEEASERQAHNEAKAAVEHAQENLDGAVMVLVDLCGEDIIRLAAIDEDLPLQKAAKDEKAQGRSGDEKAQVSTGDGRGQG